MARVRLIALGTALVTTIGLAIWESYEGPLLWMTVAVCAAMAWTLWRIARRPGPD